MDIQKLLVKKTELERQIAQLRLSQRADATAAIRKLMIDHGITAQDLAAVKVSPKAGTERRPVAPKFRDPASGATWTGRGLKPKWLAEAINAGKSIEDFRI